MLEKIVLFEVITIYPYSVLMVLGGVVCFLLFMLLSFKRHKQFVDDNIYALSMLVIAIIFALPASIVADSLFKMAETDNFVLEGATFYGGMLFAVAFYPALLALYKKRKVKIYERLCDLAPCIPAGHCLGRIGCFMGGCCFGSPTDGVFGVTFPEGSLPYRFYGGEVAVHPTQLYEAVFLAALFVFLLFVVKKDAFPLYLILYGAGRLFIEFFRNDDRGAVGVPLSPAQLISVIVIIAGAVVIAVKYNRNSKRE